MSSPKLVNKTRGAVVANEVQQARTFLERTVGLMGRASMPAQSTLWIQGSRFIPCNSIHTCFMRFAIDAVFVDRNLRVKAVYRDLAPWRMTAPTKGAWSVFELPAGTLAKAPVEIGDELHVGV